MQAPPAHDAAAWGREEELMEIQGRTWAEVEIQAVDLLRLMGRAIAAGTYASGTFKVRFLDDGRVVIVSKPRAGRPTGGGDA